MSILNGLERRWQAAEYNRQQADMIGCCITDGKWAEILVEASGPLFMKKDIACAIKNSDGELAPAIIAAIDLDGIGAAHRLAKEWEHERKKVTK